MKELLYVVKLNDVILEELTWFKAGFFCRWPCLSHKLPLPHHITVL